MSKSLYSLAAFAALTLTILSPDDAKAQTFVGNPYLDAQNNALYRMYGSPNPNVYPSYGGPAFYLGNSRLGYPMQNYNYYGGNWGNGWNSNQRYNNGYPGYNGFYYRNYGWNSGY